MKKIKSPFLRELTVYGMITVSIWIMVAGIYFFKFPNHFAFGGVTGFSSVISAVTGMTASAFTFWANMILLAAGFLFLGRSVGIKTVYASVLMSFSLDFLEKTVPLSAPVSSEPLMELVYAVFLPAIASAVLFHVGASSGGTDILAMILKKYSSMNIGAALLAVDLLAVLGSFAVFGPSTGLYSVLGLLAKSFLIDGIMDNINRCKCFNIVCSDPAPICDYIVNVLHRGATVYRAEGVFTHQDKTIIMTTMKRSQALKLRGHIKTVEPTAFIQIYNSSEIIGNGFIPI